MSATGPREGPNPLPRSSNPQPRCKEVQYERHIGIPSGRNLPGWPSFRDVHPSDRLGTIRLVPESFRQFVQPPIPAVRFDRLERLVVHSRAPSFWRQRS